MIGIPGGASRGEATPAGPVPRPEGAPISPTRLVLGAGYLGRRLACAWLARGDRVFATCRSPARARELASLGLEPLVLDVCEDGPWPELPPAACVAWCVGHDRRGARTMREVYVGGLERFLSRAPQGRFLYAGSTSVYGEVPGGSADEDSPTSPASESGRISREAEELLVRRRPDAIRLRLAGIHGPDRLIGEASLRAGRPLEGDPDRWLNLIHVEDAVRAFVAAGDRAPAGRLYNVADGSPVRRGDHYRSLAARLGTPPPGFTGSSSDEPSRRIVSRRIWEELGLAPPAPDR